MAILIPLEDGKHALNKNSLFFGFLHLVNAAESFNTRILFSQAVYLKADTAVEVYGFFVRFRNDPGRLRLDLKERLKINPRPYPLPRFSGRTARCRMVSSS